MRHRYLITICLLACNLIVFSQQLKLFNEGMYAVATHQQSLVMRFLQHYFQSLLAQDRNSIQMHLSDDKVYFRKGTIDDLYAVSDTMPFSMSLVDRHYEVSWMKDSSPFVSIAFPAQYDLLFGMNQEKAQRSLRDTILAAPPFEARPLVLDSLLHLEDGVFSTIPGFFELEGLNNATYYYKKGSECIPVFDEHHLSYSAANLFHALFPARDYRMHIEQSVYGMKTISYMLSLSQWLSYCAYWNMEVFFAVEEEREDGMLCILIARNRDFSFNHLMSIVIPDKFISDPQTVLKVRLTPYIPIHNVENIYQQTTTNKKKRKW